jgi:hypothetical protein
MRNFRKLNSAEKAGWLTAWATTLQTIAVCGALFVAFIEWRGHEAQEQIKKREATTKLFVEQPEPVTKARHVALIRSLCETTSIADPNMKAALGIACSVLKQFDQGNSKSETFSQQTFPLREYLTRVQLCVRTDICDAELSKKLFCSDVHMLVAVDNKEAPNEKPLPVSLSKECTGYQPPPE